MSVKASGAEAKAGTADQTVHRLEPFKIPVTRAMWMEAPELDNFRQRMAVLNRRKMAAWDALTTARRDFSLKLLRTPEAIRTQREVIRECRDSQAAWKAVASDYGASIRRELESRSVAPERIAELVEDFERTQRAAGQASEGLVAPANETYLGLLDEFLDLIEAHPGAWRIDVSGRTVITDEVFRQRMLEVSKRLQAHNEQAQAYSAAVEARNAGIIERAKKQQAEKTAAEGKAEK